MKEPTSERPQSLDEELRRRLEEAEELLRAIRAGEVDAFVVGTEQEQIYTLDPALTPYRLMVERVPHGAAIVTLEGAIVSANRLFSALLDAPSLGLSGRPLLDWVAPESSQRVADMLAEAPTRDVGAEITLQRVDGLPVPVYLGVSPLHEGALGPCLMVSDETQRRHYEELRQTQETLHAVSEQLREADRKKDEFLAMLAHELRNLLAPIRNAAQILKDQPPASAELQWSQGVIDRHVQRMARLLDDLLDVSRISRSELDLRREPVELRAIVDAALATSRSEIEAGGHELIVALPPERVVLDADPARLTQVISNLLNNAAKYTDEGGHLSLRARREGGEVLVAVRDDGIGIAADALPHVFEMFTQSEAATQRAPSGLGIGLSLVKHLVEEHGGTVEARSAGPGRGSEFLVRLRVTGAPPTQAADAAGEDEPGAAIPRRILIVDDNRDSADSLAKILRKLGNEVTTAYDGEQAVEAAEELRPDLMLLDIGMPKLTGYEVCRRIRAQPWGRDTRLIALTGWGAEEDRRRAEEAGFDQHLVKPVDPRELEKLLSAPLA